MTTDDLSAPRPKFALGQQCEHKQLARSCDLCDKDRDIEHLRGLVAQYKEDAERYRDLKALAYIGIAPYPKPHEVWALRLPNPSGCNDLDAAIDKARKTT